MKLSATGKGLLKKIAIYFLVLNFVFFSVYTVPKAQADAASIGLRLIGLSRFAAVPYVGEVALALAVVGAGIYIGSNYDQIYQVVSDGTNALKTYFNGLSQQKKDKWTAAANTINPAATGTTSFSVDADMYNDVRGFMNRNVTYTSASSFNTTVPTPASSVCLSSSCGTSNTVAQSFVDTYAAVVFTLAGITYSLLPAYVNSSLSNGNYSYYIFKKNADSTWNVLPSNGLLSVGGNSFWGIDYRIFNFQTTPLITANSQLQNLTFNTSDLPSTKDYRPTLAGQWISYLMYNYPLTTVVTTAPWVIPYPAIAQPTQPDGTTRVVVPAGSVTVGSTTWDVDVTGAKADTIATEISAPTTVIPADPPLDYTPPSTAVLDFSPLLLAGSLFTNKFPFSIPWDLKNQLNVFNVTPQAPNFRINADIPMIFTHIPVNVPIDLSQFDLLATIARWFLILLFDLGIILGVRRFMPS